MPADKDPGAGNGAGDSLGDGEKPVRALDPGQPPDVRDNWGIRRHAQCPPCLETVRKRAKRGSRRHHHVLIAVADPSGQQVVTNPGANGDQPVGMTGEGTFCHYDTVCRRTREVPMKQMPMKGVNAGWRTSHERGETPGDPGFRGVRVHDMWPEFPHFGREESHGVNVVAQPYAATERGHSVDRNIRCAELEEVSFSRRQGARVQPLLKLVGRQPLHKRDGL